MDFETLRMRVVQPVTALDPVGVDIRLDERFDAIRSTIQDWESLESDVTPDWRWLADTCSQLLAGESKDILLICWLAYAWGQCDPERGVADACVLVGEAVSAFGDAMYPGRKRKRALCLALDWLAAHWTSEVVIEQLDVNEAVLAQVKVVSGWLEQLGAEGDHAWFVWATEVRNALQRRLSNAIQASETAPPAAVTTPELPSAGERQRVSSTAHRPNVATPGPEAPALTSGAVPAAAGIDSSEALVKAHRSGQTFIESLCQYLRHRCLEDATAYLLARSYAFSGVVGLPPAREGVTELRPVPEEKRHRLESLAAAGDWERYIHELEHSLFRLPFWLTGHRLVAEALEKQGGRQAAQLIQLCCRSWGERFPGLTDLRFKGGDEPFADSKTRRWMRQSAEGTAGVKSTEGEVVCAPREAKNRIQDVPDVSCLETSEALRTLAEFSAGLPDPKHRLHIWLRQGELARERGECMLASAIGRGVLDQLNGQPAGHFLCGEKMEALALAAGASSEIGPELSELSLGQPHIAYQLINHT